MFRVLDNGKPAKYPECGVNSSWTTCDFETKHVSENGIYYACIELGLIDE